MPNCFVCLNECRRKVCSRCECYAHSKCWGQYLKSSTGPRTEIAPGKVIIYTPWSAACPQCRGRIMNVKPTTRSDTILGRKIATVIDYSSFLSALDDVINQDEKYELYTSVLDAMIANKTIVRENRVLSSMLKARLRNLYIEDGWLAANLYHHGLFGMQIYGEENS